MCGTSRPSRAMATRAYRNGAAIVPLVAACARNPHATLPAYANASAAAASMRATPCRARARCHGVERRYRAAEISNEIFALARRQAPL